jgi:hypothetical protein
LRGQAFALLGIEHGVAFEKRNFPDLLLARPIRLGAGDAVGIDDQFAMLALAHIAAELKRLLEGEPEGTGITIHHGSGPQHHDIDALVGDTVMALRAGDPAGGMFGRPRPHPWADPLFQIGDNPAGDLAVNIPKFAHVPTLSFWIAKQCQLLPGVA